MRRFLILLMTGLLLGACQALAATPTPLAVSQRATTGPRPTWPPTWTPTATWTATATRTPTTTPTPPPTATATLLEVDNLNRTAAIKYPATRTPVSVSHTTSAVTTSAPISPVVELRVFAIGDSVMLGAARELQKTIPGIEVDAQVSRHVSATLAILQQRRTAGRLGKVVILHIGDNGYVTAKQFDDLMQPLADLSHVVIVNLKVPRKWEEANNQVLADGVARYPNTVLIDWHTYGMDHPELFAKDGIHIGAAGAKAYAALVVAQLDGLAVSPVDRATDTP